jgi:hypothetical protein
MGLLVVAAALQGCASQRPVDVGVFQKPPYSQLDELPPTAVVAAADELILGSVRHSGRTLTGGNPLYDVRVKRTVFARQGLRAREAVEVIGDDYRPLPPKGDVLVSLTATNQFGAGGEPMYRLTWRLLSVGVASGSEIAYRAANRNYVYSRTNSSSALQCYFSSIPAQRCRYELLGTFNVRSPGQLKTFEALLARDPIAALLWMLVYQRTHASFPTKLCTQTVRDACASAATFARQVNYHPSM